LVPRAGPSQEQLLRARGLVAGGLQDMIHPADLSPGSLREALDRLLLRVAPQNLPAYYSGTDRAARTLADLARLAPAKPAGELTPVRAASV
jgi:predicted glycosyltransferase